LKKPVFWSLGKYEKLEKPVFGIIKTARQLLAGKRLQSSLATFLVAMETEKESKNPFFGPWESMRSWRSLYLVS